MKCKTLHKNLIFFLEGELPAKEMEAVKSHLCDCKECAAFAEEIKKTLEIIEKEKSPEVNPFFYTRLKAKLESQAEPKKISVWQPVLVKVIQPAFFSLLLLAGSYGGFKIASPVRGNLASTEITNNEIIPYLNEMQSEPIEDFLME